MVRSIRGSEDVYLEFVENRVYLENDYYWVYELFLDYVIDEGFLNFIVY